ncbi:PREDICTED: uncharacterized protein LOC105148533 [Acromyrmex echinatior]|uniref:uncharacterized protein LOC105148533 n=1 Tax=Acromyrmex echinatior TaxID=103372 RepID=UPI000580F28B|nr:PREDICTED: uncharacterized protein LOC105148533 [Acromyrmex echinatior]
MRMQSVLRSYPLVRTAEKMYFAKESSASYDVKKEYNITEHRAVRLLSRYYDPTYMGYKFLEIFGINPPSRGRPWRSSRTRTIAVSRNVEEPLRAARKYLQAVSKRIQG